MRLNVVRADHPARCPSCGEAIVEGEPIARYGVVDKPVRRMHVSCALDEAEARA